MSATMQKPEQRWALKWAIVIVGLTCLPYLLAWRLAPAGTQYTGLLVNALDGESYYAKMQQGTRGDWLFHLAFTPEPHNGSFIFVFYLALGHLAAITGLPIPLIYHLARATTGIFFLLVAYRFLAYFVRSAAARRATFLLLGLSAGFGWLLAPFGIMTSDLWVAEGFTFLSLLINPHFPFAIGLMLLIFLQALKVSSNESQIKHPERGRAHILRMADAAGMGLLLALVQPFAVPVVLVVLAVYLALVAWHRHLWALQGTLVTGAVALGAAPFLLYDLYVYRTNPALAAWSAQNITPSLPVWDYALGYGLILLLALGGLGIAVRRREPGDLFLLAWLGSAVVLLYVPFALQRRFITGLHVPLVLLAAQGLEQFIWPRLAGRRRLMVTGLLIGATVMTNILVPVAAVAGVAQGRQPLVMSGDEAAACDWLRRHTVWTDTVLAPADVGQFIPAWAGNRVVYGHPFETIDAKVKEADVAAFFSENATLDERRAVLRRYGVRYVLLPEKEPVDLDALGMVAEWTGEHTALYSTRGTP